MFALQAGYTPLLECRLFWIKKGDWNPDLRDELLKKNAISAITGATITTRAVRDGIETGFQLLGMAEK